ncbi:hypothetical protein [uncultured Pseudodesulfovibrio sp.]|uniref:lipase family protein n=1 Tax=uncultured Pseudodesulfovibrio sp. TaxID=2035858 RepID=UPI0029C64B10|nr:hypothetical protein [uncultured Pseudodesulfovibrio sp.]
MPNFFEHPELMDAPPIKRAAYSDRTAWIMAELSRLVYERLPNEQELDELLKKLMGAIENDKPKRELISMAAEFAASTNETQESRTDEILNGQSYSLFTSYSKGGTECMVVKIPPKPEVNFAGMFVIVFRGTEPTSMADLKADLTAKLTGAEGGGRIHTGFKDAYEKVAEDLKKDIKEAGDLPVYITGHSLGGALALVATRYIGSDSVGATYTFGGPRVGDAGFFKGIKTPVYRVVNAADGVARIPFGAGWSFCLAILRLIPLNGTKKVTEWLERWFSGYMHYGDMKMLTVPTKKKPVEVLSSPTIFQTVRVVFPSMVKTWCKASFQDHGMAGYCEKLAQYAKRRIG